MGMEAILFMARNHLNKLLTSFRQKAPCEIWLHLFKRVKEENGFKISCPGQGQITSKILRVAKQFYFLNHMLYVSAICH